MAFRINPLSGQLDIVNPSSGGGGSVVPYEQSFNATTDWGSASGGYYTITITEATHSKGTKPLMLIMEQNGLNFNKIEVDLITITPAGDVSFRVPEVPDLRFAGKIFITGE